MFHVELFLFWVASQNVSRGTAGLTGLPPRFAFTILLRISEYFSSTVTTRNLFTEDSDGLTEEELVMEAKTKDKDRLGRVLARHFP